jgi:PAS domain S-box-containing protein
LRQILQTKPGLLWAAMVASLLLILSAWFLSPASRTGGWLVRASYDWSQAAQTADGFTNPPVAIVYLDLDSYLREKQNPAQPWSRALHARLLRRLTRAGAKAVVFDIIFGEPGDPDQDHQFTEAMRESRHVVLAAEINRSSRNASEEPAIKSLQLSLPDKMFVAAAAAWGVADARMDDDFVVRRQFDGFPLMNEPSLAFATLKMLGLNPVSSGAPRWMHYYGKPLTVPHVGYSAALRADEVNDNFFRDKVIFIGARPMTGTILERKDEFRSPLTSWGDRELFMPAVEVHATQLLNQLRGDSFRRLQPLTELTILALGAVFFVWLLFCFRPLAATGIAVLLEIILSAVARPELSHANIWFPWLLISVVQIPAALTGSVLFQSADWYRQKKAFERQRRADEIKIRQQASLIEKAQDAIFVQDLSGRVIYGNPSAEKLFGWIPPELRNGAVPLTVFADESNLIEARACALARGEWLGELTHNTGNGNKVTVASRCTLIRDEQGEPTSFLFINTDVTEKKKLELEIFRAQRIESIGVIAGGMAHDLNNSLSPVLMGLQLLQQQRTDEETRRMLSVMEENTHRSADMVRQVLLFSRGRVSEKTFLSLGGLLREMERIVRQTFPKSINIAALVPADLWPVTGNPTQIHQVLLNLCVNSRDAMPHGGELTLAADNVVLEATEAGQIPNARPGRFVMLLVADTGQGIAPEILPRIFEPFFTTKPAGQGTGLGLSTTGRIITHHGGFMNVRSEIGRGTSFEVYLPATELVAASDRRVDAPRVLPQGNGELILLVDDEQSVREMISLALMARGYRVVTAANGAGAITLAEQHAGDVKLVLLDDDMPVMTGRAALPLLRARFSELKIVLMSGEMGPNTNEAGVQKMSKPFELEELLKVVGRSVG